MEISALPIALHETDRMVDVRKQQFPVSETKSSSFRMQMYILTATFKLTKLVNFDHLRLYNGQHSKTVCKSKMPRP